MRDPNRIPTVLAALQVLWETYPDMRLGQLVDSLGSDQDGPVLFYLEDDVLLERIRNRRRTP